MKRPRHKFVRGRLVELYKCLSGEEGSRQLDELITDLRHSDIQEMRHFAGTLERWSLEILNSLESIERYYEVQKDGAYRFVTVGYITGSLKERIV